MRTGRTLHPYSPQAPSFWLPWWYRPSLLMAGASLPALLLFSFSDSSRTLSRAQLFYGERDLVVALAALALMVAGSLIGESRRLSGVLDSLAVRRSAGTAATPSPPRLGEALLSPWFDRLLLAIFLVAHLIFFRDFFLNPGLALQVLGGNLELKHDLKTVPGVTTWTQVSLLLGAIRGLRWAGILPGRIKLISVFHLVFFGTLFVRAILWSERLALIEGAVPFFLCALPRLANGLPAAGRLLLRLFPFLVPVLLLLVFTAFEFFRSWQYYSGQHASILEFGWLRLYTYYFEAMNTGAATLVTSGFYDGPTWPLSMPAYERIYEGLYLGALDVEYNNVSGLWYIATRSGNVLFAPVCLLLGFWHGLTWRAFSRGSLFGLFFPISFLGLMEIIRIPYWVGLNRVLPSTLFILLLLLWAATLRHRVRVAREPLAPSGRRPDFRAPLST